MREGEERRRRYGKVGRWYGRRREGLRERVKKIGKVRYRRRREGLGIEGRGERG